MKLENYAHLAEIISGIAVVITLIFLIIGIRENTEVTRAASYQSLNQSMSDFGMSLIQDKELASMMQLYFEGQSGQLTIEQKFRLRVMLASIWRTYETAYFANQYGTLGTDEWARFIKQICNHRKLSESVDWSTITAFMADEFAGYIAETCNTAR